MTAGGKRAIAAFSFPRHGCSTRVAFSFFQEQFL